MFEALPIQRGISPTVGSNLHGENRAGGNPVEQLESRRMLSAAVHATYQAALKPVAPVTNVSPVVRIANTVNESTNTLSTKVTPAPTLTVSGTNGGDPTAPTPVITILGAQGQEPHTVFVHALDSLLGTGTCLTARYQWNFGDNSANTKYDQLVGWNAAHTYDQPGTYTVTLTLTNQLGKTRVLSTNVTIGQTDYRTIYVNSITGSDTNSGASPYFPVRSVARASQLMGDNTQLLFASGETFPVYQAITIPFQNVLIGSYGYGPEPVLLREPGYGTSIISAFGNSSNVMVENLTFNSPWASSSLTAPKIPADGIYVGGVNFTIRDCTFLNVDDAINETRNPQGVLIENCTAPLQTGLRACFLWGQGTDQVILGNYVANSTQEHNIRTVWTVRQLIAFNNLTNLNRPVAGTNLVTSKGTIDVHRGAYAYVDNNWCYDGELRVGPRNGPSYVANDTTQWTVVEGNHTFDHQFQVYPGTDHLMVRNNIFTDTNSDCISIVARNRRGDGSQDLTFANNTGISNGVSGQFINITAGGTPGSITLVNNLWLAPDVIPGMHGTAAVYIMDSNDRILNASVTNVWPMPTQYNLWEDKVRGINYVNYGWAPPNGYYSSQAWNQQSFVKNDYFTQTAVDTTYTPKVGSVAATAGVPVYGVFVDITGKVRPTTSGHVSAGALQT